jgi:class 3 adenylate cyclase
LTARLRQAASQVRLRALIAATLIVLAVTGLVGAYGLPLLAGWSLDATFWLRNRAFGPRYDPASSPSVVVAFDEETFRHAQDIFGLRPKETWTPELAQVLNALREAGVAVIGFDIVLAASVNEIASNYDREYLRALALTARENRLVLGRMQHSRDPIEPTPAQQVLVRGSNRALNLYSDPDDVVRRLPLSFDVDADAQGQATRRQPSMALELVQRATDAPAEWQADGRLRFQDRIVPGSENNNVLLNFEPGSADIPTFSFQDLVRCARAGNVDFFRQHFAGRVALIATVLDVEDRRLTSKRLITGPEGGRIAARCDQDPDHRPPEHFFDVQGPDGRFAPVVRNEIPGVYIHATAINNLLRGDSLAELGLAGQLLTLLVFATGAVVTTMLAPLLAAFAAVIAAALAWAAATTALLQASFVVPLFAPPLAAVLALGGAIAYRFLVSDRDQRLLRRSFALYLAPALVDRVLDRPPQLGGEERQATFFFSDLAGFTTISEALSANELVVLMNTYLTAMTDIIEAHGGMVDKYIGDAIAAVFGAPLDDPDHALNAVKAALACEAKLVELNQQEPAFRGHVVRQRIGINSGPALAGNIGSQRRFNYTVMGDAVNVAARLEGVNKVYGTHILAAETTVAAIGGRILFREIDRVRVVGRGNPLAIYEPLALGAGEAAQRARATAQEAALAAWRRRDFAAAAELFGAAADDPVAERFAKRARAFLAAPPPPDWEPVTNLETK